MLHDRSVLSEYFKAGAKVRHIISSKETIWALITAYFSFILVVLVKPQMV